VEHNVITSLPNELLDGGQAHGVGHSLKNGSSRWADRKISSEALHTHQILCVNIMAHGVGHGLHAGGSGR
jgi:hypothetical protein